MPTTKERQGQASQAVQGDQSAQGPTVPQSQFDTYLGRNESRIHGYGEELSDLLSAYNQSGDTRAFMNKAKLIAQQLKGWNCMEIGGDSSIAYNG